LILLNGPPAAGKSTLASRYVHEHPLTLNLDIDRVRDLVGGWRENPSAAGILARGIALAAARAHLAAGHDVVVPQFLGRPDFIEQIEALAAEVGAVFVEVILVDTKENVLDRFAVRGEPITFPGDVAEMYDRLMAIIPSRPHAIRLPVAGGVDRTYRSFLECLPR
jgi:predicted kinase